MIRKLAGCVREYKLPAIISPLCVLLESAMEILIPFYMADLIDYGIEKGDMAYITTCGLKLICFALIALLAGMTCSVAAARASAGFAKNLTHDLYYKVQEFSFANIDKFSTAGLVTRLTTDVSNIQMAFQMLIRGAVKSPFTLIFAMIMAFRTNHTLPWIFVCLLPVMAVAVLIGFKLVIPLFEKVFVLYDKLNNVVQENLRGIRVVKAYVREKHETEKFKEASGEMYWVNLKAERIMACLSPLMQMSTYGCTLMISWLGAKLVIGGSMTEGQLMSMLSYVMQVLISLLLFVMTFMMLTISGAAAKRVCAVLDEEPSIVSPENAETDVADGSIEFVNVSFGYPDCKDCLSDINLRIESGTTLGIIGGTGCGKSSMVQLIPRLYDTTGGSVLVGGKDVRSYDLTALRSAVSMVLQKNVLFSGTIADNLRWGDANATDEELKHACELAQADSFIQTLPGGYDYMLEQGGTNLSGGQRQRVCIARALVAKPKILILDDSTSAVDTATDAMIREAFRTSLPDTTKIIIAQRVSSVQDADRILVLDDGRINGIGTHEELLASNDIYREVYEAQTKEGDFDA